MLFDFFLFCKLSHVSTIVQYSFEFHRRPSLSQPNFNSSALIANYKCQMRTNKTQTDDVKPGTLRVRQHRERALTKKEVMKRTAYLESRVKELEEENMLLKHSATTRAWHGVRRRGRTPEDDHLWSTIPAQDGRHMSVLSNAKGVY